MGTTAETKQPALSSRYLVEGEPELVALVKELARLHGAAMVLQDQKGRTVPVRVNTDSLALEAYRNKEWKPVGQGQPAPAPVVVLDRSGKIMRGPMLFADAIRVEGSVTAFNFISTVAAGTQPFACASSTLNSNLNADMLHGIHAVSMSDGKVVRYNSTGSKIETGTVAESSGALSGITSLGMSGRLTNSLADGGDSPFVITSKVLNVNLNADLLDGLHGAGYLAVDQSVQQSIVNGALWCEGTVGATPISGAGTRLMWIPEKAAFRAGAIIGTEWDNANIGSSSVAFGLRNTASGNASVAFGDSNVASGPGSVVAGAYNVASGTASVAAGYSNQASGENACAFGDANVSSGLDSTCFGGDNVASGIDTLCVGRSNTSAADYQTIIGKYSDPGAGHVLVVGNGTGAAARSNALSLTFTGDLEIAGNYVLSSTRATKIGTATNQLLGFYNTTPVDQPAAVADATDADSVILRLNELLARVRELGLIAT